MCGPISWWLADSRHPELRPNQWPGTYSSQGGTLGGIGPIIGLKLAKRAPKWAKRGLKQPKSGEIWPKVAVLSQNRSIIGQKRGHQLPIWSHQLAHQRPWAGLGFVSKMMNPEARTSPKVKQDESYPSKVTSNLTAFKIEVSFRYAVVFTSNTKSNEVNMHEHSSKARTSVVEEGWARTLLLHVNQPARQSQRSMSQQARWWAKRRYLGAGKPLKLEIVKIPLGNPPGKQGKRTNKRIISVIPKVV